MPLVILGYIKLPDLKKEVFMTVQPKRFRIRLDIADHLIRAARARAGFDGVDVNVVVGNALACYLGDELAILQEQEELAATTVNGPCVETSIEEGE